MCGGAKQHPHSPLCPEPRPRVLAGPSIIALRKAWARGAVCPHRKPQEVTRQRGRSRVEGECCVEAARCQEPPKCVRVRPEPRSSRRRREEPPPLAQGLPHSGKSAPENTGPWLCTERLSQPSRLRLPQVSQGPGLLKRPPSALVYWGDTKGSRALALGSGGLHPRNAPALGLWSLPRGSTAFSPRPMPPPWLQPILILSISSGAGRSPRPTLRPHCQDMSRSHGPHQLTTSLP